MYCIYRKKVLFSSWLVPTLLRMYDFQMGPTSPSHRHNPHRALLKLRKLVCPHELGALSHSISEQNNCGADRRAWTWQCRGVRRRASNWRERITRVQNESTLARINPRSQGLNEPSQDRLSKHFPGKNPSLVLITLSIHFGLLKVCDNGTRCNHSSLTAKSASNPSSTKKFGPAQGGTDTAKSLTLPESRTATGVERST